MCNNQGIEFYSAIEKWKSDLISHIRKALETEKSVVTIALSRKMPRLLEWIEEKDASFKEELTRLLDSCVYTTEHGIPLVLKQNDSAKVLILDDFIHTGLTVQNVVNEVVSMTTREPLVLALFKSESSSVSNCDFLFIKELNEGDEKAFSRRISNVILQDNLPVDLEYPIVKTTNLNILDKSKIDSSISRYVVSDQSGTKSFAYILEGETRNSFNNDFAKLRFFQDDKGFKIVPFAPNIFSESALIKDKLFVNEKYKSLYRAVLDRIEVDDKYWLKWDFLEEDSAERISLLRKFRTLTVWANYLFSLSSFIRFKSQEGCNPDVDYRIDEEDLKLILGTELAKELQPGLNRLIRENEVSPSTRELLTVPSARINSKLVGNYKIFKYRAVLNSSTVEDALDHIFSLSKSLQNISKLHYIASQDTIIPDESYESLFEALSLKFDKAKIKENVYKWVDEQVDHGKIIPRYEQVENEFGTHYWRRYFRMSH
jgi:hypothetical protein